MADRQKRVLYCDNTLLMAGKCDLKLALRHVMGYTSPAEGIALHAGLDMHTALERHFKGRPIDKCMGAVTKRYARWIEGQIQSGTSVPEQYFAANIERITRSWIESHPVDSMPFDTDPAMVEVGAIAPLQPEGWCACGHQWRQHEKLSPPHECHHCTCPGYAEIMFCGKLDLIGIDKQERDLVPVDHKTTYRIDAKWLGQFKLGSQLTGYMWLCEQHSGKRVRRAYVNAIPTSKLPDSDKQCPTHKMPYHECGAYEPHFAPRVIGPILRTEDQIKEWKRCALKIAARYNELLILRKDKGTDTKGLRATGTFFDACGWCDFSNFCENDRNPRAFGSSLVLDPWDALAHVRGERA